MWQQGGAVHMLTPAATIAPEPSVSSTAVRPSTANDTDLRTASRRKASAKIATAAAEGPRLPGDAERDAIKPIGHQPRSPQRRPFADEHEEGGLKGVIGIRAGAEQPPADTEDHRAVAAHEQFERRPVSDFREPS